MYLAVYYLDMHIYSHVFCPPLHAMCNIVRPKHSILKIESCFKKKIYVWLALRLARLLKKGVQINGFYKGECKS